MEQSPLHWRRGPRASFSLGADKGVYALFLREGVMLPGIEPGEGNLLYIGLAASRNGLKGRCHFNARTANHSPRKSLAVLLMDGLSLQPVLVAKPNSRDTWGLGPASDARLGEWMHSNLELAIEVCDDPDGRETELVGHHAPPLNLTKCVKTAQHRRISAARSEVMASVQRGQTSTTNTGQLELAATVIGTPRTGLEADVDERCSLPASARHCVGAEVDTAEAIAARCGLNPKSYRQRLRNAILWYRKPQNWRFAVGSTEWRDMIAVAEAMVRRR